MELVQVYVVRPEAAEAVLDRLDDPAPRGALLKGELAHGESDLGRQDDPLASAREQPTELLLGTARAGLGAAAVDVGRVDEGDALLEGLPLDLRLRGRRSHQG